MLAFVMDFGFYYLSALFAQLGYFGNGVFA